MKVAVEPDQPAGEFETALLVSRLEKNLEERTVELYALRAELEAFTHSVSHDLRGPLMHIGGFADLLLDHAGAQLDDKGRQYLRTITTSTEQLAAMLTGLGAYARLSRVEMHPAPVDLGSVVRKAQQETEPKAGNRRVVWLGENLPVVQADPALLQQVVTQLLANALKFTLPREVTRIEVGAQHTGTETIVFVRDNGVGFDPRHSGNLFGVFQRLHPASAFAGHGLGLASVRRIISRHGGRTWAEGAPGDGATFYFSLPEAPTRPHVK